MPRRGKLVHQFFRGCNFGILSLFDTYDPSLEISIRELQLQTKNIMVQNDLIFAGGLMPKKRRLGPQNGSRSLGLEKLPKIVNCAKIKETEN